MRWRGTTRRRRKVAWRRNLTTRLLNPHHPSQRECMRRMRRRKRQSQLPWLWATNTLAGIDHVYRKTDCKQRWVTCDIDLFLLCSWLLGSCVNLHCMQRYTKQAVNQPAAKKDSVPSLHFPEPRFKPQTFLLWGSSANHHTTVPLGPFCKNGRKFQHVVHLCFVTKLHKIWYTVFSYLYLNI